MVKFDSETKILSLMSSYDVQSGGPAAIQTKFVLNLSKLDEMSRQLVVQAVKLGTCHGSEQKLIGDSYTTTDKEGKQVTVKPTLPADKLINIISNIEKRQAVKLEVNETKPTE